MKPDNPLSRHTGAGRYPAIINAPRSGQSHAVVPLAWEIPHHLDSGLRRNDVAFFNGLFGMKLARILIAVAACAAMTACAGISPTATDIAKIPHIQFGQPLPQGKDYVLHYPAGTALPVVAVVEGNLFEHSEEATMHVALKRDVYTYRQFVSFDGANWQPSRNLIDIRLELQIPQKDGGNAGIVRVKVNQKTEHQ